MSDVPNGRWLLRVQLIAAVEATSELKIIEAPIVSIESLDGEPSELIWQFPSRVEGAGPEGPALSVSR